jgi:hypothetical protein
MRTGVVLGAGCWVEWCWVLGAGCSWLGIRQRRSCRCRSTEHRAPSTLQPSTKLGAAIVIGAVLLGTARSADAIPAFARRTNLPCASCHTLAPELNRFGREFLDNGYRLLSEVRQKGGPDGRVEPGIPVSARLRANALVEQPEENLDFEIPSFSIEVGLPLAKTASFWTDFFLKSGDDNARLGDVVLGINGLQWEWLDLRVGQLSPPLLMDSQRRLLIDLPDVYSRGSIVNGWFLARRRLGVALQARAKSVQPGLYLFGEDSDSDLDEGRPDWAATLDWSVSPDLTVQLYGYLGDVIVVPEEAAGFRDKFRQGTVSVEYLRGPWHLFGVYSTGRHENADGLGTESTNEGALVETHWHFRDNHAAIVRFDYGDNPLLVPRRLTSLTFGLSRRSLEDHVRCLVEYRLSEGRDNDRLAVELEVNF